MNRGEVKRGDWVTCLSDPLPHGRVGVVKRVGRDGRWADVDWHTHTKRMYVSALHVEHTIPLGNWEVTDLTRKRELIE